MKRTRVIAKDSKQNFELTKKIVKMSLQGLASASRIPSPHDKVYKDECFFSFDNPVRLNFEIFKKISNFISICITEIRKWIVRLYALIFRFRSKIRGKVFGKIRSTPIFTL